MIPCAKSELNIFDSVPTQVAVTSSNYVDYHPISKVVNNAEFVINNQNYLDLNDSILSVKFKVKGDGKTLPKNAPVYLTSNVLSSMFMDITLHVNGVQVENTNHLYPYKSMFNILLNYDADNSNSQFEASGFYKENETTKDLISESKQVEFAGPLFLDLFIQSKYIIPNTEVRLTMTLNKASFVLQKGTGVKANYEIDDITLYVRTANVHPSVLKAHDNGLKLNNAIYPYQKTEMKYYNVSNGSSSFSQENLFGGRIPKFLCFGMVLNDAFNGSMEENPFKFQHFNVNFIGLYRDGASVGKELTPNFKNGVCAREYMHLLEACNIFGRNISNSISFSEYKNDGYALFAYNLAPDLESSSICKQANMIGNLRLDLRFAEALAKSINVVVMGIFDGEMQITKGGNVLV